MGAFHKEVAVTKGMAGIVRHRREKKKNGGRDLDDMHVVTVREMVLGPAGGAGDLVARSCNTFKWTYGLRWSKGAKDRIETRLLHCNGRDKGRVVFLELRCHNTPPVVVAAVCLHIEDGHVTVTGFDVTTDLNTHRAKFFDALLSVAEAIGCELAGGRHATVFLDVNKDGSGWYKDNFDFKLAGRHKQGQRRLFSRPGHAACRPSKKKAKAQPQAATGRN